MKRFTACLFLLLMASTLLTGCWNRRELNELAIAVGLGLDKDGDKYQVSIQVVNPSEVSNGKGGPKPQPPYIRLKPIRSPRLSVESATSARERSMSPN
ncbi:hypothetical protein RE628_02140 [Paenibacillus sp. D2_2]|uniref:Ger(x)C family spore germination protein n=1 Tax=Paenibacillus sp. D2_2 TaxID=3073092 RepID=UPI0028154B17|nr:hypothetical protein [Paenibacillus sp. D2_2]WMT41390.1 hypothetical protein RE628_02140 [Paenibacillus sp. D2_2]